MTLKRLAWGVAALLLALLATAVIGVRLIDTPALRAEIQQRLSAALGGEVAWQALELRFLPAPHGELRGVRLDLPGRLEGQAERVAAYLRLWPLLRGRIEFSSLSVIQPRIRIHARETERGESRIDPVAAYRSAVEPATRALRRFAPDTVFRIEGGSLELQQPALRLRELELTARSGAEAMEVELGATSDFWKRLRAGVRIAYIDLAARGRLEVEALAIDRDLPPASVSAQLLTDARTAIECDLEGRLGSLFGEAKARITLPAGGAPAAVRGEFGDVDLAQALGIARRKLGGLKEIETARGRASVQADLTLGETWRATLDVRRSDASLKLVWLPWTLSPRGGRVTITREEVDVRAVHGAVGDSRVTDAAARLQLGRPLRLAAASGRATLRLEQWLPWLRGKLPLEQLDAASGGAEVTLRRLALRFDRPAEADFDALVVPQQVSATLKALPAPVSASAGALRVGPQRVQIDKVALAMLDASALVSGSVALKGPALDLAAADGVLGEKAVQWAMQRAELPANFEPRAPLRFAARRVAWGPEKALELDARIDFDHGPQVGVALGWRPQRLELRRATVKDALSDASFSAALAGDSLQAGFAGRLDGRSIAAMLRHKLPSSGRAQGDLKLTIDRAQPGRTRGDGHLAVEALDLSWLAGRRLRVERAEVRTEQDDLRIIRARVDVEEQILSVQGSLRRTAQGPVVDARVESPGVELARLLPARKPGEDAAPSRLWPLPATGRVEVSAGFLQTERYRIEPLNGVMTFERESARLDVKQARMCGVSFPLVAEVLPDKYSVSAVVTMKDEPFEDAMRCLTGGTVEISGSADLRAELRTEGRGEAELLRNLAGSAQGELRKGRVKKFALIGNILSMRDIAALKDPKEGFAYRSLTASGRFENGGFLLDEGFFDSDAARLAAHGRVDLQGADSRLTVLVGLLTTVDRVVGAIPLIGDIFGGTMIALPVSVAGDIRDPQVVPLGPRAVSDQLLGIFERTLKLPTKLVPAAR